MTQRYTDIKSTDIVGESLDPIKDRDQANKTNFMGTDYPPVTADDVGMTCVIIKTENDINYKQVWRLVGFVDNQPEWILERNLNKGLVYSDTISDKAIDSYQPENTLLTSMSELEATGTQVNANNFPYLSGTNTFSLAPITAWARTLLTSADAATARTTLGLGSIATKNTITSSDIGANAIALSNLATGSPNYVIGYSGSGVPTSFPKPAGVPVGSIMMWPSTVLPADNTWIFCYGQQLQKSEYQELWDFATGSGNMVADPTDWTNNRPGSFYKESDSTFRVPDLRNMFIRPWDGPVGPTRVVGGKQGDAIRNITGTAVVTSGQGDFTTTGSFSVQSVTGNSVRGVGSGWYNEVLSFNASGSVPTADENRPVNIAYPFIMKAKSL